MAKHPYVSEVLTPFAVQNAGSVQCLRESLVLQLFKYSSLESSLGF